MTDEEKKLIQIESRIQEEYFVKFYDSVLFDGRLSSNEKVLLCFYIKVGGNRNYSWYGIKAISELLKISPNTIRACNKTLRELGYIETVYKTANSPYVIIVNEIQQVNGFDIIRSKNGNYTNSKIEADANFEPRDANFEPRDAKIESPVTQKLNPKKNNIIINEREEGKENKPLPSLEDVDYENFCKDYLDYFAKITARTYSDINLLLKKEIDRQDFKTMFENALFLKKSGYHWRKGMELIYKDLGDAETPMHAYFNFRDELRLLLRDDAELVRARVNKSKKQTLKNEDDKLEQFKTEEERQEFEAWLREAFKDSSYDYDDVSRRIENARKKIGEDDKQALFKKLGDMYKLE